MNKIKIELDIQAAWCLTEILSQFIDSNVSSDSDLNKMASELYDLIIKARGK